MTDSLCYVNYTALVNGFAYIYLSKRKKKLKYEDGKKLTLT